MRVIFRQVEFIPTHRKIGHSASIKWYQLSRLIGEFIECFFPLPTVHKTQKNYQVRSLSQHLLILALFSIICIVEFVCLRVQLLLVTLCSILVFFSSNPSAATISLPLAIPHVPAFFWIAPAFSWVAPAPGLRRPAPDRPPLPCVFWKVKKRKAIKKKKQGGAHGWRPA